MVSPRSANCAGSLGRLPSARIETMVGGVFCSSVGVTYVKERGSVAVRPRDATTTSTVPATLCPMIAVILVAESTVTLVAGTAPTLTVVPSVKLVPTIVISVPPKVLPVDGATDEIPIPEGPVELPLHDTKSARPRKTVSLVNRTDPTTELYRPAKVEPYAAPWRSRPLLQYRRA